MHKILANIHWYSAFERVRLRIKTNNYRIATVIGKRQLPHLLGLHYTNAYKDERTGLELYNFCKNKTDEEIYALVKKNNPDKLLKVKNRIETFRHFMENLENAVLVKRTNKETDITSEHFLIEGYDKNGNKSVLHLGLLNVPYEGKDIILDYQVMAGMTLNVALQTYFLQNDDSYYRRTPIIEPVTSIERYDYETKSYVPFSFNEEKNKALMAEYNKRRSKPSVLAEIKEAKAVIKARDKPEINKTKDKGLEL